MSHIVTNCGSILMPPILYSFLVGNECILMKCFSDVAGIHNGTYFITLKCLYSSWFKISSLRHDNNNNNISHSFLLFQSEPTSGLIQIQKFAKHSFTQPSLTPLSFIWGRQIYFSWTDRKWSSQKIQIVISNLDELSYYVLLKKKNNISTLAILLHQDLR